MSRSGRGILAVVGPGLLVAATGVGAGDLAAAAFAGSRLGTAVLWAVLVGAFIKFVVTEGLARWQLATGETLLEGAVLHIGRPVLWAFLAYLLVWTVAVGTALASACGVAAHALFPVFDDPVRGKIVFGVLHSLAGLALVLVGSFAAFERLMSACVATMFAAVIASAALLAPEWNEVARGLTVPAIPDRPGGVTWTLALMGGVGGTLTLLCYGYWIREVGREGPDDLKTTRIDLGVAYVLTALFGVAMVTIGSGVEVTGGGATLIVDLAGRLEAGLGPAARVAFLIGAWAAVFSSLLGVWQAAPYLFADAWGLGRKPEVPAPVVVDRRGPAYRGYLVFLALVSLPGLAFGFEAVQIANSAFGALVMPALAAALLALNGRRKWVGGRFANRPATTTVLVATLALFAWLGWGEVRELAG